MTTGTCPNMGNSNAFSIICIIRINIRFNFIFMP